MTTKSSENLFGVLKDMTKTNFDLEKNKLKMLMHMFGNRMEYE